MGMMDYFREYMTDIEVYELTTETSDWDTSEYEYPALAAKTISGYIQPRSGNDSFSRQKLEEETTHILYTDNTVTLNDTDRLKYNGVTYKVTYNQTKGVSGINDHYEIGLKAV